MKIIALIGLIMASLIGVFIWANARTRRAYACSIHSDVEEALKEFLSPDAVYHDAWELFLTWPIDEAYLESIRQRCLRIVEECPPENSREDISQEGVARVRALLAELQAET